MEVFIVRINANSEFIGVCREAHIRISFKEIILWWLQRISYKVYTAPKLNLADIDAKTFFK